MMTTDRAKQILACYGGSYEQWPIDERLALQQLLLSNAGLLKAQQQALYLDKKLEQLFANTQMIETRQLEQKILMNLPNRQYVSRPQTSNKFLNMKGWLNHIINPAKTISAMALMLILAISSFQFIANQSDTRPVSIHMEDELWLMAEAFEQSEELELLAILEPELVDADLEIL
jgi:hypothetical protein